MPRQGEQPVPVPQLQRPLPVLIGQIAPSYPRRIADHKIEFPDIHRREGIFYIPGPDAVFAVVIQRLDVPVHRGKERGVFRRWVEFRFDLLLEFFGLYLAAQGDIHHGGKLVNMALFLHEDGKNVIALRRREDDGVIECELSFLDGA